MSVNVKHIDALAGIDVDFFTGLVLKDDVKAGRNVLIYSFEGLQRPVYLDFVRIFDGGLSPTASPNSFKSLKIVFANSDNQNIVLVDGRSDYAFEGKSIDVGCFAVTSKDRLIFDFNATSEGSFKSLLSFTGGYSDVLHYKKHLYFDLNKNNKIGFKKHSFDYAEVLGTATQVKDADLLFNRKSFNQTFAGSLELSGFGGLSFVKLFDKNMPVPYEDFEFSGTKDESITLHTERKLYNKECVKGRVDLFKELRSDIIYSMKNDHLQYVLKALAGEVLSVENVQASIDLFDKATFNKDNSGYYDTDYKIPVSLSTDGPTNSLS